LHIHLISFHSALHHFSFKWVLSNLWHVLYGVVRFECLGRYPAAFVFCVMPRENLSLILHFHLVVVNVGGCFFPLLFCQRNPLSLVGSLLRSVEPVGFLLSWMLLSFSILLIHKIQIMVHLEAHFYISRSPLFSLKKNCLQKTEE
jgi:hypothetical protein